MNTNRYVGPLIATVLLGTLLPWITNDPSAAALAQQPPQAVSGGNSGGRASQSSGLNAVGIDDALAHPSPTQWFAQSQYQADGLARAAQRQLGAHRWRYLRPPSEINVNPMELTAQFVNDLEDHDLQLDGFPSVVSLDDHMLRVRLTASSAAPNDTGYGTYFQLRDSYVVELTGKGPSTIATFDWILAREGDQITSRCIATLGSLQQGGPNPAALTLEQQITVSFYDLDLVIATMSTLPEDAADERTTLITDSVKATEELLSVEDASGHRIAFSPHEMTFGDAIAQMGQECSCFWQCFLDLDWNFDPLEFDDLVCIIIKIVIPCILFPPTCPVAIVNGLIQCALAYAQDWLEERINELIVCYIVCEFFAEPFFIIQSLPDLFPNPVQVESDLSISGTASYDTCEVVNDGDAFIEIYDINNLVVDSTSTAIVQGFYATTMISPDVAGKYGVRVTATSNEYEIDSPSIVSELLIVTEDDLPNPPVDPFPPDFATNVSVDTVLSWSNGGGATSFDVYFGTDSSPDDGEYQGEQASTTFDPGTLNEGTTYYWRIDPINDAGLITGRVWRFTTVDPGGRDGDYEFCCSGMCLDVDEDPPFDCFDETPTVGIDDERIYAWFRLTETCTTILGARWEWFRPDGSLWGDVSADGVCDPGGGCDGPCTWYWWIPIADTDNADWQGTWVVKMYVDAGRGWEHVTTEEFVVSHNITEHSMCQDVQPADEWPFECINPTNVFYQTDEKAASWTNLALVANALEVEWRWFEPNGSEFTIGSHSIPDANDEGFDYWENYRTWHNLLIDGFLASTKCGQWQVELYTTDPFGTQELEYVEEFLILEDPNVAPVASISASPENPLEDERITLIISASDNTYLDEVTVSWHDGEWSEVVLADDLNATDFDALLTIGSFEAGQHILFHVLARDTSGNVTVTETQTVIVQSPCAEVISVPADYSSIQAAIDAVCDGGEITVEPGTYAETIDFLGKAITVRSSDGPEATVIDSEGSGRVVTFNSGEDEGTVLDGFTITGGSDGGGMLIEGTSPTVLDCHIVDNSAEFGGGIYISGESKAFVGNCVLSGNTASANGGGVLNTGSSAVFLNCTFEANLASTLGGGAFDTLDASTVYEQCDFLDNEAGSGGGIGILSDMNVTITDCNITGNAAATSGGGVYAGVGSSVTLMNSNITGNVAAGSGGGLYVAESGDATIGGTLLCDNTPDHISGDWIDGGGNEFCPLCDGDIDGDGIVGTVDLIILCGCFGLPAESCTEPFADINEDGIINSIDLTILLASWGPCQ